MPLDQAGWQPEPKIDPVLQPGLAGLAQLEHALRNPEVWPADFVWDFSCNAGGCAQGLRRALWPESSASETQFRITTPEANNLFGIELAAKLGQQCNEISPLMVADAISALLKEKGYQREVSYAA